MEATLNKGVCSGGDGTYFNFPEDLKEGACIVEMHARDYATTLDWLYVEPELLGALQPTPIVLELPWDEENFDPVGDMDDDTSY